MNLPPAFAERMQQQLGSQYNNFVQALGEEAPVSLRLNRHKWSGTVPYAPVPWTDSGYYLPERPLFALDPLWHAGAYYVQEASSMFLEQAFKQYLADHNPLLALDLCGAPGGKSTHISTLLPEGSLLVSNEVIRSRANILAENIQKWGLGNTLVTNSDPEDFARLEGQFDVMVVDAPCSGEGLFRRDAAAQEEWSPANVQLCMERQRRILMDVWPALKQGGLLVYSTCTYNLQENEENLQWLSKQEAIKSLPLEIPESWGIEETQLSGIRGYRFYPHRLKGEGFFMAVLQKEGGNLVGRLPRVRKARLAAPAKGLVPLVQPWLLDGTNWEILQEGPLLTAFPKEWISEIQVLYEQLRVVYGGIQLVEPKGKSLIPQPALALSTSLNPAAFPTVDTDLEATLRFLRKDDIMPENSPDGWVLICYRNIGLGWLKMMKNRSNNYWPTYWRIRMELPSAVQAAVLPL
jgi:16S rRNA C967 or C1407 C5-methylase (RsmB/RsmF family)/NOL1/NOP2/fmu family ribosome biogenesis protein